MLPIRITAQDPDANALRGAVASLGIVGRCAVELYQHRVVHVHPESTATVGGVDQSFSKTWFEADPSCSVTEMKKMMMANGKGGAWLPTRVLQKSGTHSTKERSFTELRFASFQLDCEVSCQAVKGQDERRHSAAPLTTSQLTSRGLCSTEEN